jgi:hypothetical protein
MLFSPFAPAYAACPQKIGEQPIVSIQINIGQPRYHFVSRRTIAREQQGPFATDQHTTGLFTGTLAWEFSFATNTLYDGVGASCTYLQGVVLEITAPALDIYIDHQYSQGSCEYNEILTHENQHYFHFMQAIRDNIPALETALRTASLQNYMFYGATPQSNMEKFSAALQPYVDVSMKRIKIRREKWDALMDSPENYAATTKRCNNW